MTNKELVDKLELAQRILDEVYTWASDRNDSVKESMSVADCAIYDALVALRD